ncbi:MAG: hypothetical protein U9R75_03210, partial [Candidatus Thermoplasmatota archaeon]|nr:hypothetical protein [Candidatus Thermoplasmatota archaeon]
MECPKCSSSSIIKHGKRITKNGSRQIYLCRSCNSTFSNNPLKNATEHPELILKAVTFYNLGYSLQESSDMLRQIYGRKVPRNTIHYWTKNYRDLFPYLKVKKEERIKIPQHDYNGSILRV